MPHPGICPDPRPLDERTPRPAAGPLFLAAPVAAVLAAGVAAVALLAWPHDPPPAAPLPDPCAVVQDVDATGAPAGWTVLDPAACADAPVGPNHPAAVLGVLPTPAP